MITQYKSITMHRQDDSLYILYIEPKKEEKLIEPIEDNWSKIFDSVLKNDWLPLKTGISNYFNVDDKGSFDEGNSWRGWHTTDCGEMSTNNDYLLFNGMITNSLAPFYVRWYRNSIPESEWIKLNQLRRDYYDWILKHFPWP